MSKHTLSWTAALLLWGGALAALPAVPARATEANVKCDLKFSLSAWSALYQQAEGSGHVTCGNGQQAAVTVVVTGWGLTAGKFTIHGTGEISNVRSINDVFGSYTQAGAEAGVVRSGIAQVLTEAQPRWR